MKKKAGIAMDELARIARCILAIHTAKNATDLMQVVDFIGLMQVANKLYQAC